MTAYEESGFFGKTAIVLAVVGVLLIVLAAAVWEGYLPSSLVLGMTATNLGVLATLAIVGAAVCYTVDR